MMAGSGGGNAVAGGSARHIPVLARQTLGELSPHAGIYVDGTFGAGGHTRAILSVAGTHVIGIDRHRDAIAQLPRLRHLQKFVVRNAAPEKE